MEGGLTSWVDFTVIGVYFLCVLAVSILSMFRKNRESVKGYFLAGRNMHWIPIGASMFASNIGSKHFIGLAGSGAASGIAVVAFEWGAVLLLILLGWVFLPVYLSAQIFTIPEYLGRRFGGYRMRIYLSCVALSLYVLVKISVDVYAGGLFIQQATGWDIYLSMIPLLIITAIYTIAGGLAAVVYTDTLQSVIMLVGAVILAILAYIEVGGTEALYNKYMEAYPAWIANHTSNSTCGLPRDDAFHVLRDPVNSDLPWPGVMIRATLASLWYWCADQVIVQRALAARNMAHARGASLLAGFLKLTPLFIMVFPGMISRALYPEMVACADPDTCMAVCGNPTGCSNIAYPLLILKMAPVGMRGLMMAAMVAALMSSLTSIFNSAGTVFTMDIWRKFRPQASEKQLLVVGRLFVVVLVAVSIIWIPLIVGSQKGQLFIYIQAVTGYVAPPICSIFLMALFVPRINETGAFWGVVAGQATGVTRLILDFVYPAPGCGQEDTRPLVVARVNFTYFSAVVLAVTAIVALLVSLTTPAQDKEEIEGLTWWTLRNRRREPTGNHHTSNTYVIDKGLNSEETKLTDNHEEKTTAGGDGFKPLSSGLAGVDSPETETIPVAADIQVEVTRFSFQEVFNAEVPSPWCHVLNAGAVVLLASLAVFVGFFA